MDARPRCRRAGCTGGRRAQPSFLVVVPRVASCYAVSPARPSSWGCLDSLSGDRLDRVRLGGAAVEFGRTGAGGWIGLRGYGPASSPHGQAHATMAYKLPVVSAHTAQ